MRRPDWEPRLNAYIAANLNRPHAYGKFDCLLFVAGAVKAQTGKDFARGHRGKYKSAASAAKYLKKLGFASPEGMIDNALEEKSIAFAQRGDVVLSDGIPGICMGAFSLFVATDGEREGLLRKPTAQCDKAWGV